MQYNLEYMHVAPLQEEEARNISGGIWWQAIRLAIFLTAVAEDLKAGIEEGWKDADKSIDEQFN